MATKYVIGERTSLNLFRLQRTPLYNKHHCIGFFWPVELRRFSGGTVFHIEFICA